MFTKRPYNGVIAVAAAQPCIRNPGESECYALSLHPRFVCTLVTPDYAICQRGSQHVSPRAGLSCSDLYLQG